MAITGGVKLFTRSKCLVDDDTLITATSGEAAATRAIDRNPITYWRSVGSTDATVETLDITLSASRTFDRLLLLDHNWKQFTAQYWNGSTYVNFASVVGLDGSLGSISETVFSKDTAYYEFTPVTTDKVRITVTKTQVVDAQKYVAQIILTEELGTLTGYPKIKGLELNAQRRTEKMLSGRILSMRSDEVFKVTLEFDDYPNSLSDDIDLMFDVTRLETSCLIWLCGGRYGTTYFRKQLEGYRLRDVFSVQSTSPMKPIYTSNVYINPVNFAVTFEESVL